MNKPTMVSTPVSSAGLPDTVTPNTTSARSVRRDKITAQAIWSSVFSVTPRERAPITSRSVASAPSRNSVRRGRREAGWSVLRAASPPPKAAASNVGSGSRARCSRQTRWLAS